MAICSLDDSAVLFYFVGLLSVLTIIVVVLHFMKHFFSRT